MIILSYMAREELSCPRGCCYEGYVPAKLQLTSCASGEEADKYEKELGSAWEHTRFENEQELRESTFVEEYH